MKVRDEFAKIAPEWVPDKVMDDLIIEEMEQPDKTAWDRGVEELEAGFPMAVRSVVQLAVFARDERTRLNAAKYVIAANINIRRTRQEREQSPLEKMFEKFEAYANSGHWLMNALGWAGVFLLLALACYLVARRLWMGIFALVAAIVWFIWAFGGKLGTVNLFALGLGFAALEFAVLPIIDRYRRPSARP
jgi:hypothetical protein